MYKESYVPRLMLERLLRRNEKEMNIIIQCYNNNGKRKKHRDTNKQTQTQELIVSL